MVKKEEKKAVKKTMKSAAPKTSGKKSVSLKKLSNEELGGMIAKKAYEFYLERGGNHGDDHSDWYKAECFVRSKYKA